LLADFALAPLSPEARRRAALAVCHRCETVEEAKALLEALGLLDVATVRGAA
jgi:hypothetical protein